MMKKSLISYPYVIWMLIFIFIPILLVLYYSLRINTPSGTEFSLDNFKRFMDPLYINVLIRSVNLALISTAVCLLVGYPAAMILAGRDMSKKNTLVVLFVIPMWMNFLLRTYAWLTLLEKNGLINKLLSLIGLHKLSLLYTNEAVVLGMVYNFLPFMVLPIYSVLSKIDKSLVEAAEDLGANRFKVLIKIILPLSLPGVVSGITMVFMPAVTTFVISRLLGGGHYTLVGNLIEQQFLTVGDWGFGSSISIIMMILILISMGIMSKFDDEKSGGVFL